MHSHVTYTNILVCIHRTWNNQNITEDQSGGWGGRKKKKKGEGKEMWTKYIYYLSSHNFIYHVFIFGFLIYLYIHITPGPYKYLYISSATYVIIFGTSNIGEAMVWNIICMIISVFRLFELWIVIHCLLVRLHLTSVPITFLNAQFTAEATVIIKKLDLCKHDN